MITLKFLSGDMVFLDYDDPYDDPYDIVQKWVTKNMECIDRQVCLTDAHSGERIQPRWLTNTKYSSEWLVMIHDLFSLNLCAMDIQDYLVQTKHADRCNCNVILWINWYSNSNYEVFYRDAKQQHNEWDYNRLTQSDCVPRIALVEDVHEFRRIRPHLHWSDLAEKRLQFVEQLV